MIDRSEYLAELEKNPELRHRLAVIVAGEVGSKASPEQKMIQLETIFNRAQARGQSIEKVTRMYTGKGSDGYYPPDTFRNGERIMRQGNNEPDFHETILKPVLDGSDVGTEKFGFAPTGNASAGVARRGIANGRYTQHAAYGDPKNPETYVQEGRFDNVRRIELARVNRPPAAVADTNTELPEKATTTARSAAQDPNMPPATSGPNAGPPAPSGVYARRGSEAANAPPSPQQQVTADLVAKNPGYQPPDYVPIASGGATPLPKSRPADAPTAVAAARPAPAQAAPATTEASARKQAPSRQGELAKQFAAFYGPTQPGGIPGTSGGEGGLYGSMGLARDIGPRAAPASPAAPGSRQAQPPGTRARAQAPPSPDETPATRRTVPDTLAKTFDVPPDEIGLQPPPGPPPPGSPPSAAASVRPPQADFVTEMFKNAAPPNFGAGATTDEAQRRPLDPFSATTRNAPFPRAPEEARLLAPGGANADPSVMAVQPKPVDQQLNAPPQMPLPAPQSMNLSPFQQWPPPWWDTGGGFGFGGSFGGGGGGYDFGAFA
jgi:hypothetical protein